MKAAGGRLVERWELSSLAAGACLHKAQLSYV